MWELIPKKNINLVVEITPSEAEGLIKFIEYLIKKWYIEKHEEKDLLTSLQTINIEKKELRKP